MSDVVVSVTESTTSVTVTEQDVAVAVTETPVTVTTATVGLQGIPGANGSAATITAGSATVLASTATPTVTNTGTSSAAIFNFGIPAGSAGSAGVSGVISVTSPITNTGSSSSAILGIDQTLLSITKSQVSDFTSGTVTYATTSGTATYATTSGTSVSISGSITKSQVSDFTSGTVAYASLSGTAVAISGSAITVSQISDFSSGTVANISGTVAQTQVTGLVTALAGKASTSAPTITGFTTLQATPSIGTDTPITAVGGTGQSVPLQSWKNVGLTSLASVDSNGYGNFARVSAGQSTDLAYSAALSVNTTGTATKGVVVRGVASQSANIQEWQDSAGATANFIAAAGNVSFALGTLTVSTGGNMNLLGQARIGTSSTLGMMTVLNSTAANTAIVAKGATSQTGDLFGYQNSGGTVLGGRNAVAQAYTGSTTTIKSAVGGTIQSIATGANPLVTMQSTHNIAVGDLVTLASTTGGTYDGTFVVATTPAATTFTITTALTAGQASAAGTVSVPAQKSITSRSAATKGIIVRAATSQAVALQEWQDSTGTLKSYVDNVGNINFSTSGSFAQAATGRALFITNSATTVPMTVKGATSQSANLQEWQNDGGTVIAYVNSGGVGRFEQLQVNSGYAQLRFSNSGGHVQMTRKTSSVANPGANEGAIYFVAGTNTGTLKLVVRAGAAGAETTILDNIPQ